MFVDSNPWNLKKVTKMPVHCPECGQPFELEVGFWYGTGYVSYVLSVLLSALTFIAWILLIGMSVNDNRFFWWMGINVFLLIVLQPWLMRLSRVIYLYFFVRYHPDYKNTRVTKFDYDTETYYRKDDDEPQKS
jgi:hypothetical protein